MWPGLVQLAKEGGANVIETYVFWNGHELSPGNVSEIRIEFSSMILAKSDPYFIYMFDLSSITLGDDLIL